MKLNLALSWLILSQRSVTTDSRAVDSSGYNRVDKRILQENTELECDPESPVDVDTGILSCGRGEYCMESSTTVHSKLSGICVANSSRRLQGTVGSAGSFLPVSYCDPSSFDYGLYECDCSNFNVLDTTGTFQCTIYEEYCFSENLCGQLTVSNTLYAVSDESYGGIDSAEYCGSFQIPFNFELCYVVRRDNSCDIVVDGIYCHSCNIINAAISDIDSSISYECYEFDCSNTIASLTGNDCSGPVLLEAIVQKGNDTPTPSVDSSTMPPPSYSPTSTPTISPSNNPSFVPSWVPSQIPTASITDSPSLFPTYMPSTGPSSEPTSLPTIASTSEPTVMRSMYPTIQSSEEPTIRPSLSPTLSPSNVVSDHPSFVPSSLPTENTIVQKNKSNSTTTISPSLSPSLDQSNEDVSQKPSIIGRGQGLVEEFVPTNDGTTNTTTPKTPHCDDSSVPSLLSASSVIPILVTIVPPIVLSITGYI